MVIHNRPRVWLQNPHSVAAVSLINIFSLFIYDLFIDMRSGPVLPIGDIAAQVGMKRGAAFSQVHPLINSPAQPAEGVNRAMSYVRVVVGGRHPDLRGWGLLVINLA